MENEELADFTEEKHTIQDTAGETYSVQFLRSEDLWDMKLLHDGRMIGEANCLRHGESLFLGNIEIINSAAPPAIKAGDTAPQPKATNYRRRGLGTLMLEFIIAQARRSGFQQIRGHLHPLNLHDKPDLPDWYRRRGFDVRMNEDGRGGTISFNLKRD